MNIPEITEISRLVIQPGDRIIIRVDADLTEDEAAYIKEKIQRKLELPEGVRLIVVQHMKLEVLAADL